MDTCTRGLKRGASNSAETIPTNQPIPNGPGQNLRKMAEDCDTADIL